MELLRWCISVPLALLGVWILLCNWIGFISTLRTNKPTSLTPIIGGVFVAVALVLCPVADTTRWWWAPLAADLSIIGYVFIGIYALFGKRLPSA